MPPDTDLNIVHITDELKQNTRALEDLIRTNVDDPGYVVVRGFDMGSAELAEASEFLLGLGHALGTPISHDENGTLLWDIRANDMQATRVPTFSEHADEAFLHTDSQYRQNPEDIFALYCLSPAADGGGESLLMTYDDLMTELVSTPERAALVDHLKTCQYPFSVPSKFKQNPTGPDEFVFSPILEGDGKLRFRVDTLEHALQAGAGNVSKEGLDAFKMMKSMLETSSKVRRFSMERGDLFFLNNRRSLHGRTSFTDKTRHLLRIRLAYENA